MASCSQTPTVPVGPPRAHVGPGVAWLDAGTRIAARIAIHRDGLTINLNMRSSHPLALVHRIHPDAPEDLAVLAGMKVIDDDDDDPILFWPDGRPVDTWREEYPYPERLNRHRYHADWLQNLQVSASLGGYRR